MSRNSLSRRLAVPIGLCAILFSVAGGVLAGPSDTGATLHSSDGMPRIVRAYFADPAMLQDLGAWTDHFGYYPEKDLILLEVDGAGEQRLRDAGFYVEVDEERTARLHRALAALAGDPRVGSAVDTIPGFPCYRTVEETLATGQNLASSYPTLATWTDVGDSWEKLNTPTGYDLMLLRLTNTAIGGAKPTLFLNSSIHPREYTTAELNTRFAEMLLNGYGVDPDITWLLDYHEIHLLLVANPDGRKRAETGLSWRKNANPECSVNPNQLGNGVDLNRNFTFQWGCCGGSSSSVCSTTYRGSGAGSEPETQAIMNHMLATFPDQRAPALTSPAPDDATGIAIDIHSFGEVILWSWGFSTTPPPNNPQIFTLGRKMGFYNGYRPVPGSLSTVDGSTKDFVYGELGVPGFTLELGTSFFESCGYFEESVLPKNLDALLFTAKVARTPYLTPAGPEAVEPQVPPLPVTAGAMVAFDTILDDTRYSTRNGVEPTQDIAAGEVTVDLPPWDGGAVPVALTPADGNFDSRVEDAQATLDTTGLAPGRHTVFARGQDAAGSWGPVSAAFLWVVDPASSPVIEGTVRDARTGNPLIATVQIGGFEVTSNAAGFYQLQVPSGTYEVRAAAERYQEEAANGVVANDFQTVVRNFFLEPYTYALEDDVEGGNLGWIAQGSWAITTEAAHSPIRSWTDSPGGNYGPNADSSLISPIFDFSDFSGVILSFQQLYDLEAGFDFARVEISTDGGGNWTEVRSFSGPDQDVTWSRVDLPLPQLDGVSMARLRLRLTSDGGVQEDGWHLDDIALRGIAANAVFADGFESGDLTGWTASAP